MVRRAILSIARKNGKTALIGALVLVHLVGPEAELNGEIYSAANDREQAAQVFKFVAQMIDLEPELQAILKVTPSTKHISCYSNGSFYKALSADAGTKHGLNPTFVVYDELAQSKNRELYDTLDTAMAARAEPLMVVISTQSPDPEHILSLLIDNGLAEDNPTTVCHLYEVPAAYEGDIFTAEAGRLANPALGDFRSLDEFLDYAKRAKTMPSFENSYRNLYLNQRVSRKTPVISEKLWKSRRTDRIIEPGSKIYLSLDMSSRVDLCALGIGTDGPEDIVDCEFFKPEAFLDDHSRADRVPYSEYVRNGYLHAVPGNYVNPRFIARRIGELMGIYEIIGLSYDRWRIDNLIRDLDDAGIESQEGEGRGLRLIKWGQGFRDMAPAIDAFEESVMEGRFWHRGNPLLTWCVANAVPITDEAGNRKFDKSKTRLRIDGALAVAMLLGAKRRDNEGEREYLVTSESIIARGGLL